MGGGGGGGGARPQQPQLLADLSSRHPEDARAVWDLAGLCLRRPAGGGRVSGTSKGGRYTGPVRQYKFGGVWMSMKDGVMDVMRRVLSFRVTDTAGDEKFYLSFIVQNRNFL